MTTFNKDRFPAASELCSTAPPPPPPPPPDNNPPSKAFVWLGEVVPCKNGPRKTLIHRSVISSIHENVFPMISFLPLLLEAILRRPLSRLLVGLWYILPSCQNTTVVSGCHQASFTPLPTSKTCPHMAHMSLPFCLMFFFFCLIIFTSDSQLSGSWAVSRSSGATETFEAWRRSVGRPFAETRFSCTHPETQCRQWRHYQQTTNRCNHKSAILFGI